MSRLLVMYLFKKKKSLVLIPDIDFSIVLYESFLTLNTLFCPACPSSRFDGDH